ncbi:hypothetical protein [Aromatoleum evansii]|uniref:hypothetical protein n=1 Tax=Aromatoleum evansii TaxID=59406 RepID=UPI001B7CECB7|nr:hypothetical protein [Aromatoleum evansii]
MRRNTNNPDANSPNAGERDYAVAEGSCPSPIRAAAILLARYQIKSLRRLFEEFERDILLPLLLGEIALHNIGALENSGEANVSIDGDRFAAVMRPCNAYSIAAATGLPRETVRRKIVRLVELGWITRRGNGHLFLTPRAIEHFGALLGSRDLPELLDTADRIRKRMQD